MSYAKEIYLYHIRQAAARVAKLVMGDAFETCKTIITSTIFTEVDINKSTVKRSTQKVSNT